MKEKSSPPILQSVGVLLFCLTLSYASSEIPLEAGTLLKKMEAAYALVKDYRIRVEVRTYKNQDLAKTERFLYTFKKPGKIRLDFESPHSGLILVYPDKNGKVLVQPSKLIPFFKLHLEPGNRLLVGSSGQQIDQTEMGLLIQHIVHSLTEHRRGAAEITEANGQFRIRVLADNPFRKGVVTLYRFFIDKELWLPSKVEESTPEGHLERIITFENLKINGEVPDEFFEVD